MSRSSGQFAINQSVNSHPVQASSAAAPAASNLGDLIQAYIASAPLQRGLKAEWLCDFDQMRQQAPAQFNLFEKLLVPLIQSIGPAILAAFPKIPASIFAFDWVHRLLSEAVTSQAMLQDLKVIDIGQNGVHCHNLQVGIYLAIGIFKEALKDCNPAEADQLLASWKGRMTSYLDNYIKDEQLDNYIKFMSGSKPAVSVDSKARRTHQPDRGLPAGIACKCASSLLLLFFFISTTFSSSCLCSSYKWSRCS